MASLNISDVNPLPPGWDCKYDNATGKRYYINYFTRNTSFEDPRVQMLDAIPLQDFTANTRLGLMMGTNSLKRQQSAIENQQTTTTDQAVTKISAMFPTVTETHIRTLLLKYLKSVFPVVEETMLLDTLSSSDNNVHRATQTLLTMGFDKRATPPPRVCLQRQAPPAPTPKPPQASPHRMKSVEEKQLMKVRLREKHKEIPERVVSIALDSVDYDETRADQILSMMEDDKPSANSKNSEVGVEETNEIIIEESPQASSPESPPGSPSTRRNQDSNAARSTDEMDGRWYRGTQYRSPCVSRAIGADPSLPQGHNQALLLVFGRPDYVAWTGRDAGLAVGPDPSLRGSSIPTTGPDPRHRKGPNPRLAKGSIYSQLSLGGLSLAESRGK